MEYISKDFLVLAQATQHANLSAAAKHIGISQPQLSRIIGRMEEQLQVKLLDRTVRRKSAWTKEALRIAGLCTKTQQDFEVQLDSLIDSQKPKLIRIGTLEGMIPLAMSYAKMLFEQAEVTKIWVDVFDQGDLEESFLNLESHIIFTQQEPSQSKYIHRLVVGYQNLQEISSNDDFRVLSKFEEANGFLKRSKTTEEKPTLVTNSLAVRRHWLTENGGRGWMPSDIYLQPTYSDQEKKVLLIGQETLNRHIWEHILQHTQTGQPQSQPEI